MTTPTTDIFSLPHTTPQNVEMPRVGLSQGEGEGEPSSSQNQQLNWYHNADVFNGAVSSLPHYSITYKALKVVPIFSATFGQAIKQAYIYCLYQYIINRFYVPGKTKEALNDHFSYKQNGCTTNHFILTFWIFQTVILHGMV